MDHIKILGYELILDRSDFVESVIAFSICYVALETLLKKKVNYRWLITFGFGLVHATIESRGYGISCSPLVLQQDTNRTVAGQWLQTSLLIKDYGEKKDKENPPMVSMKGEEREEVWDEAYVKEEGIILEFDPNSNTGKIKSLLDDSLYSIDSRELLRPRIELRPGDKVFFAPFEDSNGNDYARVIRIIELNTSVQA